ncbi:hypothetical protein CSA56_04600 [candidate division KSB3 bacterium]|uniref:Uncharacterized protein n=1 Tax=candidate division KSB3 bacterium TaxID=2044937 RepID=A0A2G6KI22_9BACT|nr:MAG: hypothetical protein CSA56_04600 [candidate division KSB3 bacterium]
MEKTENLDELRMIIVRNRIGLQGRSQYFNARMLFIPIDRYWQDKDIHHLTSAGNFRFKVISLS